MNLEILSQAIFSKQMMSLAEEFFPIARSLTGQGVRDTLEIIRRECKELQIIKYDSGQKVGDWTIPREWKVNQAYIIDPTGRRICDFDDNNLHLVGYSAPFRGQLELAELREHIHYLEDQPQFVPYVTSYYRETWGFCMSFEDFRRLNDGTYQVVVDTDLFSGQMEIGEIVIPGESDSEIFLSTYICHPSMANNEVSGPVLAVFLSNLVQQMDNFYTYRFVFAPETIGPIAYLSSKKDELKKNVIAAYNLTCVGDDRTFSFLPSRDGNSVSDRVAKEILERHEYVYEEYSWLDRGSDERQYCSPGVDLPMASLMRSKYGEYPEYHTDADQLNSVVTGEGLFGSLQLYARVIAQLESLRFPKSSNIGEPFMTKYDLYSTISRKDAANPSDLLNFISMSDGTRSVQEIGKAVKISDERASEILEQLCHLGLVRC